MQTQSFIQRFLLSMRGSQLLYPTRLTLPLLLCNQILNFFFGSMNLHLLHRGTKILSENVYLLYANTSSGQYLTFIGLRTRLLICWSIRIQLDLPSSFDPEIIIRQYGNEATDVFTHIGPLGSTFCGSFVLSVFQSGSCLVAILLWVVFISLVQLVTITLISKIESLKNVIYNTMHRFISSLF